MLKHVRGITLLESLVAMAILASALLALLGGQLYGFSSQRAAVHRAEAVRLVEDLGERIRSYPTGTLAMDDLLGEGTAAAAPDCERSACDAATLAQADIAAWKEYVALALPQGQATLFVAGPGSDAAPGRVGVIVAWHPGDAEAARAAQDLAGDKSAQQRCPAPLACHRGHVDP